MNMMRDGVLTKKSAESLVACIDPSEEHRALLHSFCKTSVRKGATQKYREMLCKIDEAGSLDPMLEHSINALGHIKAFYEEENSRADAKKRRAAEARRDATD